MRRPSTAPASRSGRCSAHSSRTIPATCSRSAAARVSTWSPIAIDLSVPDWPLQVAATDPGSLIAILCINVVHISPWRVSENLLAGVPRLIRPDGGLFIYGAFKRGGAHTAPSNAAFDASLRAGNPEWGLRDMDDLGMLAERAGLRLADAVAMPANNFVLVFERRG